MIVSIFNNFKFNKKSKIFLRYEFMVNRNKKGNPIIKTENLVRLNKFLSDHGITSRRKADELIQKGFVKVNGKIITELGTKVQPNDRISVSGKTVSNEKKLIYIILNKPKDYITTTDDEFDRKTVLDIVKTQERIFPVGRLDRNTTGLLLLTNDGELTFRLTHPKYKVEKIYSVGLDKELKFSDAKQLSDGIELEEGMTAPCQVLIDPKDKTHIILTIYEGKNHEVKRMFETLGYHVKKLERKMFAGLDINGLKRGEYRKLTKNEINSLKKITGLV